ncbi:MAG: M20/M25/M40 family metallo-hydrolase [Clostridia bacterium]
MKYLDLVRDLTNANGVSGFEEEVVEVVKKYAVSSNFKVDTMNNVFLTKKNNKGDRPVFMIDGHSDEVGFMVQFITANGLIKFIAIGGWQDSNICAHKVRIRNNKGEYIKGVVSSVPPHFLTAAQKDAPPKIENMLIDVGATSRDEVINDFGIEVAAPIVPDVEFTINANGIMCAKAFDDRIGAAAVIATMEDLAKTKLNVDLVGTVSSQEEVGLRGAEVSVKTVGPDIAIVYEGTPADDTFTSTFETQAALKKGPQLRHRDGSMITNPRFIAFARKIAKEHNIVFQDAVRAGGGTDAGKIHMVMGAIPTIVIGIPVRYAHTHFGYCAYDDFMNAVELGKAIIKSMPKDLNY